MNHLGECNQFSCQILENMLGDLSAFLNPKNINYLRHQNEKDSQTPIQSDPELVDISEI